MFRSIIVGLTAVMAVGLYFFLDWSNGETVGAERTYVGRDVCATCHQQEAELYRGSHHDLAMDKANEQTVLGDFDNQMVEHHGQLSRLFRRDDKYLVETEGPDGQVQEFEITHVFGVHPLQQYLVRFDSNPGEGELGQLQVLRLCWDVERQKWFHLDPPDDKSRLNPDDPLHWTGITQRWNSNCAACHSTNLRKNYDVATNRYHTTFSEIDVSCEACHGPGSLHVKLAGAFSPFWDRKYGFGLAELKTASNQPQVDACAPCHSLRKELSAEWRPGAGQTFASFFSQQLISEPFYFVDGQQREEVYTHNSFLQSRMYKQGIRCSDCHDPHSTRVKFSDNRLCTSCHQHPAAKYDSPEHHHHPMGSASASCVECHMPATTYMEIDGRRDHSLRVPRPDLSLQFGTPNACTGCHLDKSKLPLEDQAGLEQYLDWINIRRKRPNVSAELAFVDAGMAAAVEKWYGWSNRPPKSGYYEQLARLLGNTEESNSESLAALVNDESVPVVIRASALQADRTRPTEGGWETVDKQLRSREVLLAQAALARFRDMFSVYPIEESVLLAETRGCFESAAKLLLRPEYTLQIEAFDFFSGLPPAIRERLLRGDELTAFSRIKSEWFRSLELDADRAGSHAAKGNFLESERDLDGAAAALRTGIAVEPNLAGARTSLAYILEQKSEQSKLRAAEAARIGDSNREAVYLGQSQDLAQEVKRLRLEDHRLLSLDIDRAGTVVGVHELHYRFALSCYLQGDWEKMEQHLKIAIDQAPEVAAYQLAYVTFLRDRKRLPEAAEWARGLLALDPQNVTYQNLLKLIQAELTGSASNSSR